jgi:hypothetical protein
MIQLTEVISKTKIVELRFTSHFSMLPLTLLGDSSVAVAIWVEHGIAMDSRSLKHGFNFLEEMHFFRTSLL